MKSIEIENDVYAVSDGETNCGFYVYGSIRDLFDIVHRKTLEYEKESDSKRKLELKNELDVIEKSLFILSSSSKSAATTLKNRNKFLYLKTILLSMATTVLLSIIFHLLQVLL